MKSKFYEQMIHIWDKNKKKAGPERIRYRNLQDNYDPLWYVTMC